MAASKIVVVGGVRYRREDAEALGILDGGTGPTRGGALSLGSTVNVDDIVEARVAAHVAELDQHADEIIAARRAELEAEFEAELDKRLDAALAEAGIDLEAGTGDKDGDSAEGAEVPPVETKPATPANRARKTQAK